MLAPQTVETLYEQISELKMHWQLSYRIAVVRSAVDVILTNELVVNSLQKKFNCYHDAKILWI